MSDPLQFRLYAKICTIEDVKKGVQPIRDGNELYCPAMLQYRIKRKLHIAGAVETEWSEWQYIEFVKEGAE